jgi:peptidyl-prolyl cis-trans isomerase A (cyclophilin A)
MLDNPTPGIPKTLLTCLFPLHFYPFLPATTFTMNKLLNTARRALLSAVGAASLLFITAACATPTTKVDAPRVKLVTTQGDIVIELDAVKAPKSVENFLAYVKAGHYNGTLFHRVIDNFMIQGGGFDANVQQKPTQPPIPLESRNGLKNDRGTVAMARTNVPDSATSQFFINVKNNDFLNGQEGPVPNGYAVFGKVIAGMDVVDKIRAVQTNGNSGSPMPNMPTTPILIKTATLEK